MNGAGEAHGIWRGLPLGVSVHQVRSVMSFAVVYLLHDWSRSTWERRKRQPG